MLFSERKGLESVRKEVQADSMDDALRASLWSIFDAHYWAYTSDNKVRLAYYGKLQGLCNHLWFSYFKVPLDTLPIFWKDVRGQLRSYFFECDWNKVYDFIEFVALNSDKEQSHAFQVACNQILEREMSAYRFVDGQITQITAEVEINAIEAALANGNGPVEEHLTQALKHLSNRESPDYRNSIKESISAVEAKCRLITGKRETLPDALKQVETRMNVPLHPAFKEALIRLYGWTSDAKGIRHALSDPDDLKSEDAKFMLVTCSAFINYLEAKIVQLNRSHKNDAENL
jgi:hypothetical protein